VSGGAPVSVSSRVITELYEAPAEVGAKQPDGRGVGVGLGHWSGLSVLNTTYTVTRSSIPATGDSLSRKLTSLLATPGVAMIA
jgi:hypothetical protein